jgi:hypothetical protein
MVYTDLFRFAVPGGWLYKDMKDKMMAFVPLHPRPPVVGFN